jgi:hypothetical protein
MGEPSPQSWGSPREGAPSFHILTNSNLKRELSNRTLKIRRYPWFWHACCSEWLYLGIKLWRKFIICVIKFYNFKLIFHTSFEIQKNLCYTLCGKFRDTKTHFNGHTKYQTPIDRLDLEHSSTSNVTPFMTQNEVSCIQWPKPYTMKWPEIQFLPYSSILPVAHNHYSLCKCLGFFYCGFWRWCNLSHLCLKWENLGKAYLAQVS